jgi:hypothetical protein
MQLRKNYKVLQLIDKQNTQVREQLATANFQLRYIRGKSRPCAWSGGIAPSFLTSALDGGKWSASRPDRLTPGERAPGTHWI